MLPRRRGGGVQVRRYGMLPGAGRGQIEPATRERLRQFFRPYNERLATLLGDDGFRWGY